ncbi:immunity 49 family protein [Pseudoalteromonas sp. SWXJZ94C]|uniref:immunity 49 family protein n=1 Tax=Pseudoalteromonas sp. SWXJZ94C TaxID=2792065 RepID=UPI0018CD2F08|nr:immunity 49 family protein [Pseudoalteromonas sp. SWXJZ94C]MBH0059451.1 immunity 49 family protein [Pseudoalteromonas sp. SWXJZ94C]
MINITRDYEPMLLEHDIERFEEAYNEVIEDLPIKRDNLIYLLGDAIKICQWWSFDLTEENKQKSIKALKIVAKAGEAIFRLGREPEKEQRIVIDDILDATYKGLGLLENGGLHAMRWQEAFFAAAIVRDYEAMDSLVKFPVSLMRKCSSKSPEAEYLLTELIQCIHRRESGPKGIEILNKLLDEVIEGGKKEPWVAYGTGSKSDFIISFTTKSEATPSEALASALTENWKYCERHRDLEGYEQPTFYMPINLLGLACMAKDLGNELNVQSDFIPQFYIDGDYL